MDRQNIIDILPFLWYYFIRKLFKTNMSENQLNTEYPKPSAGTFFDGDDVDDIFVFHESSLDNSPTYEGMLQGPGLQSYIDPVAYPIQDEAAFNEWYTQLDESQKAELIALKSEFEQTLALHANTREKLTA